MAYILNSEVLNQAMKRRGFKSLAEFSSYLKVHRNTLGYYLAGAPVFSPTFEKMIDALGLKPAECIQRVEKEAIGLGELSPIIDSLVREFPGLAFVLFGSRAKGSNRAWSDFDIGVCHSEKLTLPQFLKVVAAKDNLAEDFPAEIQLVNLNNADGNFLKEISKAWRFLGGSKTAFLAIEKEAHDS